MSTTIPEKCPKCGSNVRASIPDVGIQFECAAIALESGHFSEALPCVMRQRDQLTAEVDALRTANAGLVEKVKRLEDAGDTHTEWVPVSFQKEWNQAKGQP